MKRFFYSTLVIVFAGSLLVFVTSCKKDEIVVEDENDSPITNPAPVNITGTTWTNITDCPVLPDNRIKAMAVVDNKLILTFLTSTNICGRYSGFDFNFATQSPMDFMGGTGIEKICQSNGMTYGCGFFNDLSLFTYDISIYWPWEGVISGQLFPVNGITYSAAYHEDKAIVACATSPYVRSESPGDWVGLGSDFDAPAKVIVSFNGDLIAGGNFTSAGGSALNHVARWDGNEWLPMNSGLDGNVNDLIVFENTLIAIGDFSMSGNGNQGCSYIARWNGTDWEPMNGGLSGGNYGALVATAYGDQLFVAGDFDGAMGIASQNIIKWTNSGWEALPGIPEIIGEVAVFKEHLYAVNHLENPGGNFLVRLD